MWWTYLAAVMVTTCWACSANAEKADVEIGMLTCTLGEPGEAPTSDASSAGQMRDAHCTFKPKNGAEETYAGKVQGVSISADQKGALIWVVKSASGAPVEPGLLQQTYAIDPTKPADQKPPMLGEANSDIALHSMADKSEGSASASEKPEPTGFVILSIELKLKSTSG
jgi:uncharacterized protein DUF992